MSFTFFHMCFHIASWLAGITAPEMFNETPSHAASGRTAPRQSAATAANRRHVRKEIAYETILHIMPPVSKRCEIATTRLSGRALAPTRRCKDDSGGRCLPIPVHSLPPTCLPIGNPFSFPPTYHHPNPTRLLATSRSFTHLSHFILSSAHIIFQTILVTIRHQSAVNYSTLWELLLRLVLEASSQRPEAAELPVDAAQLTVEPSRAARRPQAPAEAEHGLLADVVLRERTPVLQHLPATARTIVELRNPKVINADLLVAQGLSQMVARLQNNIRYCKSCVRPRMGHFYWCYVGNQPEGRNPQGSHLQMYVCRLPPP
jgi:hypothetical protein